MFFYATRLIAGMGIGGQYAAINSAIDEMMPSKYQGRVDIWINGSYWAGAILGSFASLIFLNAFAVNVGWRLAFLMGPVLALVVIVVARTLPESPRWLLTHGRVDEAEAELAKIEAAQGRPLGPVSDDLAIELVPEKQYGYLRFLRLVFHTYPKRAILGATLMITQSFLYNAIFFTYALVLTKFYDVARRVCPVRPGVLGRNLLGPLILGPLFDTVGRKMISGTYLMSGLLLAVSAFLFDADALNATTQTLMWIVIFFFASAGASAAYLTVSETWPIEIRSEAIAVFFAIGTIAGALGPAFYGALIGDGSEPTGLFIGYLVGAGIMVIGGVVEWLIGSTPKASRSKTSPNHSPQWRRETRVLGGQEQDRPDQEADRADERAEVRQLGVAYVPGRRHHVGSHRGDAEGDGSEHVGGPDPPVPAAPFAGADGVHPCQPAGDEECGRSEGVGPPHPLVGDLGAEVHAHGVARAPVEPQRAGELHGAGEPGDVPWCPHPEAPPRPVRSTPSTASRYCRKAADVKNTEPAKNVNDVARNPAVSE